MDGLSFRVITPRPNARRRFDRWWLQPAEPDRSLACLRHAAAMGRAEPQRFRLWLIGMGPTIGRKRRARRARGRRIEARRRQGGWLPCPMEPCTLPEECQFTVLPAEWFAYWGPSDA